MCFEEGVQFAEVDDGDNEGYEPVHVDEFPIWSYLKVKILIGLH